MYVRNVHTLFAPRSNREIGQISILVALQECLPGGMDKDMYFVPHYNSFTLQKFGIQNHSRLNWLS